MSSEEKLEETTNGTNADAGVEQTTTTDSFVASMSFAQMQRGSGGRMEMDGCDCDECGYYSSRQQVIPATVQEAINRYKRRKLETGPLKRTQDRVLAKRGDGHVWKHHDKIAVWQWTMPRGAEPLLEFGNSHRFVWIKLLPGKLYSIGQGIVGSEAEEKMRRKMKWQEKGIYFVPSSGGKAVGWVHKIDTPSASLENKNDKKDDSTEKPTESQPRSGPADILIAKVPADEVFDTATADDSDNTTRNWTCALIEMCQKYSNQPTNEDGFVAVSNADTERLRNIMS